MEAAIRKKEKKKAKKARKRASRYETRLDIMPTMTSEYINTLNDPFEYGPCRLGFGTLCPTNLYTGYFRSTFTLNADGSGALVLAPCVGSSSGSLLINTGTATSAAWSLGSGFVDRTAIGNSATEGRVVSIGLRAIPQVAATSVPGVIACGQLNSVVFNQGVATMNTADLLALPQLRVGVGALGGTACGRPIDPASYTFLRTTITGDTNGLAGTTVYGYGAPVIVFSSFAASTNVFVEGVINVETTQPSTFGSNTAMEQSGSSQETVADTSPSIESMWSKIKTHVSSAGTVDHVGDLAAKFGRAATNVLMNRYFNGAGAGDLVVIDA